MSFFAAVLPILLTVPVVEASTSIAAPRPSSRVSRIVLVGDSLAHEVSGLVQFLASPRPVVPKFWGGTAPCDWLGADLQATRSTVVVISFSGNALTPCMDDGAGGALRGDALVERYRADLTALVAQARASGARVLLIGQPRRAPSFESDAEVEAINAVSQELAKQRYVSFVDAGGFVELNGEFTERLPCMPIDAVCGDDGQNIVRGDGVHFCPAEGPVGECPVWSSGALRFGLVITHAALRPTAFE